MYIHLRCKCTHRVGSPSQWKELYVHLRKTRRSQLEVVPDELTMDILIWGTLTEMVVINLQATIYT